MTDLLLLGMYATLIAGFLQDPLRKLIDDEPVYLSALVIVFAAATFAAAGFQGALRRFRSIPDWNRSMGPSVTAFILIVIAQSIATFAYTGSPVLPVIGLIAYLAPFAAFSLAYSFASSYERVTAFLWLYVILSASMAAGVYLSWAGSEWDLLRTVGEPLTVYPEEGGGPVQLPAGFLRSPEVAAWHAAAGFCISVLLGLASRRVSVAWGSAALALFFLGAVVLTGRRKFLVELMIFLPLLLVLLIRFRAQSGRLIAILSALSAAGMGLALAGLLTGETTYTFAEAAARREQRYLGDDLQERIVNMTIGAFQHVVDANGFFGSGAGSGSQGAQHFGGGDEMVGLAAEGGLGKVLAEVGVPGMLVFLWAAVSALVYLWRTLGRLAAGGPGAQLALGLTAFLAANSVVFVSAHQAFGDPFVLLLIGFCFAFVIAARGAASAVSLRRAHALGDPAH